MERKLPAQTGFGATEVMLMFTGLFTLSYVLTTIISSIPIEISGAPTPKFFHLQPKRNVA